MHSSFSSRFRSGARFIPYLTLPALLLVLVGSLAFRSIVFSVPDQPLGSPLVLPPGWSAPPTPADNPISMEKFVLGRQLFYEGALSSDGVTSCASCHDQFLAFSAGGFHVGASGDSNHPARSVMRLMNVGYDTVLTWDGHIQTLEQQATIAIQKKGDLFGDTTRTFPVLASNPAYIQMFTAAFGDGQITMDRIAKSIATFERCLISGNSYYDQYLNGNTSAMSASAIRGMNLFFDTTKTNCSECHNNMGTRGNMAGNIFSDNAYYRTGTFELMEPGIPNGGYGLDTSSDTLSHFLDAGRAAVTLDSSDIGRFRTPSLRNVALKGPYGADGTVLSLQQVIENYNMGGNNTTDGGRTFTKISNKDPRIKPLHLDSTQVDDIATFLNSLTDLAFISNTAFQQPTAASIVEDGHLISGNLSLYPNPSSGSVQIDCPDFQGTTDLTLFTENGSVVWHQSLSSDGKLQLDLSSVPNGTYRLRLRTNAKQQIVPLVLAR
jgi:cytochrome c peroxidase